MAVALLSLKLSFKFDSRMLLHLVEPETLSEASGAFSRTSRRGGASSGGSASGGDFSLRLSGISNISTGYH